MGFLLLRSFGAHSALGERRSKALAGVMQALVKGAPGGVQPLGQDIDRYLVECEGDEDLSLARGEARFDLLANGGEQVLGLGIAGAPRAGAGDPPPRVRLERHLAARPGPPP